MVAPDYYSFHQKLNELNASEEEKSILTEAFFRVMSKVSSPSYKKERFLYLLIEEMTLLFDILVARVSANEHLADEADILTTSFGAPEMNITEPDYREIVFGFSGLIESKRLHCLSSNRASSAHIPVPLRSQSNTTNSIDTLIVFPLHRSMNDNPVGTLEIYYSNTGKDVECKNGSVQGRNVILAALLQRIAVASREGNAPAPFLEGLSLLLSEALTVAQQRASEREEEADLKKYPEVRKSKQAFLESAPSVKEAFVDAYKKQFAPLDKVFTSLMEKFELDFPFYFSYRLPKDNSLSFFFTAKNLQDLLTITDPPFTVEEFADLWMYPYRVGGANGYILKTAHPVYLPNQHADARWTTFAREEVSEEDGAYEPERQKNLLLRMFRLRETDQIHSYIVPVLVFHDPSTGAQDLIVAMHYTTDKPISNDLRKRIFDLAWDSSSTVELSILAQQTTEQSIRAEHDLRHASEFITFSALLGHTIPKFVFKPTEYYIEKMMIERSDERRAAENYQMLRFYNTKGQVELKGYLDFFLRTQEEHASQKPSTCNLRDVLTEMSDIFGNLKSFFIAGHIDQHDRDRLGTPLRDLANERIVIQISDNAPDLFVRGSRESHLIALWNFVDNALNSFELGRLYDEPATRLYINLQARTENDHVRLSIANNGRQIPSEIERLLTVLIEMARENKRVARVGRKHWSDEDIISELRKLQGKEKTCQGVYRTSKFLYGLSDSPGYITLQSNPKETLFELYIPKK